MSDFMRHVVEFGEWVQVDGDNGTETIPADVVGALPEWDDTLSDSDNLARQFATVRDYVETSRAFSIEKVSGWGARLSAPGFLDCTEWAVFETEREALDYLRDMYGDDDESPSDE